MERFEEGGVGCCGEGDSRGREPFAGVSGKSEVVELLGSRGRGGLSVRDEMGRTKRSRVWERVCRENMKRVLYIKSAAIQGLLALSQILSEIEIYTFMLIHYSTMRNKPAEKNARTILSCARSTARGVGKTT